MRIKFLNKKIPKSSDQLTLIVCSCDKYSDLWYPYFEIFKNNWPAFPYKIVLNTETKSYTHDGLDIVCLQLYSESESANISWSERMIETLKHIDTDYVMLTCEDDFIVSPVDLEGFARAFDLLRKNRRISMLSFAGRLRASERTKWLGDFGRIPMRKKYRVVLDTAIWRKDALLRNLVPGENPWEFEINATQRALWDFTEYYRYKNYDEFNDAIPIVNVPYTCGSGIGLSNGVWRWKNPELFEKYNIKMDFSIRGYLDKETCKKLSEAAISGLEEYKREVEDKFFVNLKIQTIRRLPPRITEMFVKIKRIIFPGKNRKG